MTKNALDMMADLPQEADEEPAGPEAPAVDFIRSLVGLSTDEAFWKCLRADVDIRIGIEDGIEAYYSPNYFPHPWGGGVFIDIEKGVVITARHMGPDPVTTTPKRSKR